MAHALYRQGIEGARADGGQAVTGGGAQGGVGVLQQARQDVRAQAGPEPRCGWRLGRGDEKMCIEEKRGEGKRK